MDFHSLRLFLHLTSTLNYSRTSQACNISSSALSRTIQRLEIEVGLKLFARDNRRVEITPEGREFQNFAKDVMERWDNYRESIDEDKTTIKGEIKIYSSVTAAYSVLTGLFREFREKYPLIHIKLQTGASENAIPMILDGSADITVAAKPDKLSGNLRFKTITETPLLLIAPSIQCEVTRMLENGRVPWDRIPMILPEQGLSRTRINNWFANKSVRPIIYAEVAGHEAIISMVQLGCGIGVVPELVLEMSRLKNEVSVIKIKPFLKHYSVGICARKMRLESPAVKAFWELA